MRNLAIARAGETSRHQSWLSDVSRKNFDLLVAYYGDCPGTWKDTADFYDHWNGLKYPWIHQFLPKNPWVLEYDAVWLCDDDIEADTATVADMFDIFHEKRLWLAQPAQTSDCFLNYPFWACRKGTLLRFTEFVEEQMPIFSKETLAKLAGTFGESKSGWGLGAAWPRILGYPPGRMAVIDATPMRHTRAGNGTFYTHTLPSMGVDPHKELRDLKVKYGELRLGRFTGELPLEPADPRTPERAARQR